MVLFLRPVRIYEPARVSILSWPYEVKKDLGSILTKLQKGDPVGYPDTKSMMEVTPGCFEVRLKGRDGIFRVFYVLESKYGILVFHGFQKKTQKTPIKEILLGRKRLQMFLEELSDEEG